jgi:hypothetical protein
MFARMVVNRLAVTVLVVVLGGAAAAAGCATTWTVSQIAAGRPPIDENAREEAVPIPGVEERLEVVLHLSGRPPPLTASSSGQTAAPQQPTHGPLEIDCAVTQHGRETVYRAATRYGKSWKKWTAAFFLLEGLAGSLLLLAGDDSAGRIGWGVYLAVDALGTGALFFAPRRDVYEQKEREVVTRVREDCPAGLLVEVDGRVVPVDAVGGVGDLGQALFERHLVGTQTPIRVRVGDSVVGVDLTADDRCAWARKRQHDAAETLCTGGASGYGGRSSVRVVLDVPLGTLIGRPAAWLSPR